MQTSSIFLVLAALAPPVAAQSTSPPAWEYALAIGSGVLSLALVTYAAVLYRRQRRAAGASDAAANLDTVRFFAKAASAANKSTSETSSVTRQSNAAPEVVVVPPTRLEVQANLAPLAHPRVRVAPMGYQAPEKSEGHALRFR